MNGPQTMPAQAASGCTLASDSGGITKPERKLRLTALPLAPRSTNGHNGNGHRPRPRPPELAQAKRLWLLAMVGSGRWQTANTCTAQEIRQATERAGVSWHWVREAAKALRLESRRETDKGGAVTVWAMPAGIDAQRLCYALGILRRSRPCSRECGATLILHDEDGDPYCFNCTRRVAGRRSAALGSEFHRHRDLMWDAEDRLRFHGSRQRRGAGAGWRITLGRYRRAKDRGAALSTGVAAELRGSGVMTGTKRAARPARGAAWDRDGSDKQGARQ